MCCVKLYLHWTGPCPQGLWGSGLVELTEFKLAGLVSRWTHLIPPGSVSAALTERASHWVGMGSGEWALSGLSERSFMTQLWKAGTRNKSEYI